MKKHTINLILNTKKYFNEQKIKQRCWKINPYHHALSSAKKFGGKWEDYIQIHHWFDESKRSSANPRHRALHHHSEGIFDCERLFGYAVTTSNGRVVPTRFIGEQHVKEDLGFIPSMMDWFKGIPLEKWMILTMRVDPEVHEQLMLNVPTELRTCKNLSKE